MNVDEQIKQLVDSGRWVLEEGGFCLRGNGELSDWMTIHRRIDGKFILSYKTLEIAQFTDLTDADHRARIDETVFAEEHDDDGDNFIQQWNVGYRQMARHNQVIEDGLKKQGIPYTVVHDSINIRNK